MVREVIHPPRAIFIRPHEGGCGAICCNTSSSVRATPSVTAFPRRIHHGRDILRDHAGCFLGYVVPTVLGDDLSTTRDGACKVALQTLPRAGRTARVSSREAIPRRLE